jgi:hypothetical protein
MLRNTDCYGIQGLHASSGQHVKALLGRTTDGLTKAMTAFDASLARIKDGGFVPWTASAGEMTLLHAQWVASLTWQWATVMLDSAVTEGDTDDIDDASYALVLKYCGNAADLSVKAMQMADAFVRSGKRPGNTAVITPSIHVNATLVGLMWTLVESTNDRVCADLALIRNLGVPERFKSVFDELAEKLRPQAEVFAYHKDQWRMSLDLTSRRQILQDAMRLLPEFYKIGQQLWAPYLLGRTFIDVLRTSIVFDNYNLGIDPWVMTDPAEAAKRAISRDDCVAVAEFWKTIAEPRSVVAIQNLINDALALDQVARLPGKNYQIPPWHGQYRALEEITLGEFQCDKDTIFAINFRGAKGQRTAEIRKTGMV